MVGDGKGHFTSVALHKKNGNGFGALDV